MGQLLSLALLALLAATQNTRADSDLDRSRMEELNLWIGEIDGELGRILKDLKDYETVVTLWNSLQKNYLYFTQQADTTVAHCYSTLDYIKRIENDTGLKTPYKTQISKCQVIIRSHKGSIDYYYNRFDRIRRDVNLVRTLAEDAARAADTNQRNRDLFEIEKRLIESMRSTDDSPGTKRMLEQKGTPLGVPSN
tara:strand:- start:10972 stop:11553 length:582 start_codon:yes stop_codon:yes gene_type:complete